MTSFKKLCYCCPCCCTIPVANEELPLIQNDSPREIQPKNVMDDNGIMLSMTTIQISENYKTYMKENNDNKTIDYNKDNMDENKHLTNNDNEKKDKIRIVTISDSHMKHDLYQMPKGDILIVAGDFTNWKTSFHDYPSVKEWLKKLHSLQLYSHQILISGNHDLCLSDIYDHPRRYQQHHNNNNNKNDSNASKFNDKDNNGLQIIREELWNECHTIYLHDSSIQLFGLTFYGTPWHIKRGCLFHANAFGKNMNEFNSTIKQIPKDVDILITHFPPYGIGDFENSLHIGSDTLLDEIKNRIKPIIHIFGHVHQGAGIYYVENCFTTFANTAVKPRVFDIIFPNHHTLQLNVNDQ